MLKAKRLKSMFVLYSACAVMATGFTSQAASERPEVTTITETKKEDANTHTAVQTISQSIVASAQEMTDASQQVIAENIAKKEEEERIAREKAEQEAREQAEREAREAYVRANQELMASIIYCEAGNQPYEGQVAVGAVIMNRVKSGSYPDSIEAVIYQSGQFGPAATGWLNRVRSSKGYSQTALQAAVDALNGSNPIGNCLYFDQGGSGMKIGAHYFH
ncbi:cell wall hydrolase [Dorea sp.]|uniref:cell wall hydrolase n=1 Tax=Dorea sp. TaxID=2040332 RepID=UPI003529347B